MEQNFPEESPTPTPITPTPTTESVKPVKSSGFLVVLLSILLIISVLIAGFFAYQTQNLVKEITKLQPTSTPIASVEPQPTTDPTADWKIYTHPTYKYQFKYPPTWSVAINQYAQAGVLFGLSGDLKLGMGGVEIREIPTNPKDFNKLTESEIINQIPITVNGISGFKTTYSNVINGTNFVFRHTDDLIYNVYINSELPTDLEIFDQILSTFKFIEPESSPTTSPQP